MTFLLGGGGLLASAALPPPPPTHLFTCFVYRPTSLLILFLQCKIKEIEFWSIYLFQTYPMNLRATHLYIDRTLWLWNDWMTFDAGYYRAVRNQAMPIFIQWFCYCWCTQCLILLVWTGWTTWSPVHTACPRYTWCERGVNVVWTWCERETPWENTWNHHKDNFNVKYSDIQCGLSINNTFMVNIVCRPHYIYHNTCTLTGLRTPVL